MFALMSECISINFDPPQFLLSATTELMKFYPLLIRASLVLQRLVQ